MAGSILLGQFLSPGIFLALTGAVLNLCCPWSSWPATCRALVQTGELSILAAWPTSAAEPSRVARAWLIPMMGFPARPLSPPPPWSSAASTADRGAPPAGTRRNGVRPCLIPSACLHLRFGHAFTGCASSNACWRPGAGPVALFPGGPDRRPAGRWASTCCRFPAEARDLLLAVTSGRPLAALEALWPGGGSPGGFRFQPARRHGDLLPCSMGTPSPPSPGGWPTTHPPGRRRRPQEGCKLVLVPGETPLSAIHLETCMPARAGARHPAAQPGLLPPPEASTRSSISSSPPPRPVAGTSPLMERWGA